MRFIKEEVPLQSKFAQFLRFFVISSGLAVVISILFFIFFGSPIQIVLNHQSQNIKNGFTSINNKFDSLHVILHSNISLTDKYYREILKLDSLPTPIRIAGTGGSNPYDTIKSITYKEIIATSLKKADILKKQLKVQDESFKYVFKEAVIHNKQLSNIPAISPIKPANNTRISSKFGIRTDPFTHRKKSHKGLDFVGPKNTKIYATANGIVTISKDSRRGYGKEIVILHNFGYSTRYAHLNKMLVSTGEKVTRGQLIGLMGSTGRSTGTHLHYEVRLNKRPLNPINYFAEDLTEEEYELITKRNQLDEEEENGKTQL